MHRRRTDDDPATSDTSPDDTSPDGTTPQHTTPDDAASRPLGREAVRSALVQATTELIVERGLSMSVREISARAGVNHGLVHTYFGSKEGLLTAAFDEINARAAAELDDSGYPPQDLALRRNGEITKALARVMLDSDHDLFTSHPVTSRWRKALAADHPEMTHAEITERVMIAGTLGLGWALFAEHMSHVLGLDEEARRSADRRVCELIADIGGIPGEVDQP